MAPGGDSARGASSKGKGKASVADAPAPEESWSPSSIKTEQIQELVADGFLREQEVRL